MGWFGIRSGIYRYLPGLTRLSDPVFKRTLKRLHKNARIADVGAGGRRITPQTFTIDRFIDQNTDIVADIHAIPLSDGSFDVVFCTGALEHVEYPKTVIMEIYRILSYGGIVHIEVPFLQPFHADPKDYWRWTLPGLELFCSRYGFEKLESGVHMGPASSLNWVFNEFVLALLGNGKTGAFASAIFRFLCYPILLLDGWLVRSGRSLNAACGVYFVGRKI